MKEKLDVSINPTYACNMDCSFCYLKGNHNSKIATVEQITNVLTELSKKFDIANIDIYGGEVLTLPSSYLLQLYTSCLSFSNKISFITNGTVQNSPIYKIPNIEISFSWDYKQRPNWENVLLFVDTFEKFYNKKPTLILTSPSLNNTKYEINYLLNNTASVFNLDIKPCYKTRQNDIGNKDPFEAFQSLVLFLNFNSKHFLLPVSNILKGRNKTKHVFIDPDCRLIEIGYSENGEEVFIPFYSENINADTCDLCGFYDKCFMEHSYTKTDFDCCGQSKLVNKILNVFKGSRVGWRERRKLFYLKYKTNLDDVNLPYLFEPQSEIELVDTVVRFFASKSELIYPAKSYYVAIIYAYLLNEYFGENILTALDKPDLLNYDDKYFVPYSSNPKVYDLILGRVYENIVKGVYDISKTRDYFLKEFLINGACCE